MEHADMEIRPLTPSDAATYRVLRLEALRLEPEAFSSDFEESRRQSIENFADRLAATVDRFTLGAFLDDALAGVVTFVRRQGVKVRHKGTVVGMYVNPDARGRGIGRRLLEAALARACAMPGLVCALLEVTAGNTAAERLYGSVGFEPYGIERGAIRVDDRTLDSVLMSLSLERMSW
jgi:ribosomal protein S18 acetylase RimI-like enzyme